VRPATMPNCNAGLNVGSAVERITVDKAGAYLITFSACVVASAVNKHVQIWLKVDGANVARTNTVSETPISGEDVVTVTYIYVFTAGQYFELAWASEDDASMILNATAAGTTPTTPASPAVICTVNKISK